MYVVSISVHSIYKFVLKETATEHMKLNLHSSQSVLNHKSIQQIVVVPGFIRFPGAFTGFKYPAANTLFEMSCGMAMDSSKLSIKYANTCKHEPSNKNIVKVHGKWLT